MARRHHPGLVPKLVAHKFDGSKARRGPGTPRIKREIEQLIVLTNCGRRVDGSDDAELGEISTDRIDHRGLLADKEMARAM